MTGFLCKQIIPYVFTYDTAVTAGALGTSEVRFNNVTEADITTMFISLFDKDKINRLDWMDGFFTSTVPGRDLLTVTYKSYTSLTIATATAATPTVITTTTASHGLSTGDVVRIFGAPHTPLNGTFEAVSTAADEIQLKYNGADFGIATAVGSGSLTTLNYNENEVIFEIEGTSVAVTAAGIATITVDHVSGDLPSDGTDVTISYNKAGIVNSKFWYGNCTKVQEGLGLCSSVNGGWVPAVTVCKEEL